MQPVTMSREETIERSKPLFKRIIGKIPSLFKKHRKKKIAAVVLIAAAIIAMQAWGNKEKGIPVSTGDVIRSGFEQTAFATGKLEVKGKQEFYAENRTTIQEVKVKAGEKLAKGQVVLRMDDSSLAAEVSKNRLSYSDIQAKLVSSDSNIRLFQQDYDLAKKNYDNTKTLLEADAVSLKELEDAEREMNRANEKLVVERDANLPLLKSQLEQARLTWKDSEEQLQKAAVVSPIDGVLLNLPVKEGQRVEPGALLAEIGNPGDLQIETGINEVDAAELKVGDPVEITNNALLKEPFTGRVEYIAPIAEGIETAQGKQTQVKIRIAVDKAEKISGLKPGYNVNLKIVLHAKEEAVLVPYEAVVKKDKQEVVFVVGQDGIVAERTVQTGLSNELFFEITSGLDAGEKVVLNPGQQIENGVKVMLNAAS